MSPDFTFVDYDSGRDGQIAVSTITLAKDGVTWFDATGIDSIVLRGTFAGGTTQVFVDQGREGTGAALVTSTDQKAAAITDAGAVVPIAYPFVQIRITQTVGATTNAQLAAKGKA